MSYSPPEWVFKPLTELTQVQWEALCDGCGKCCMAKLQDEETDVLYYTNVACELFDAATCRCQDYENRSQKVVDCLTLSLSRLHEFDWLPESCAYRLRASSKPLPKWHPLMTGKVTSTYEAGISVKGKTIAVNEAGALEYHIVDWR